MSWFSILPQELSVIEVWAVRFFLFLGLLSIGPWFLIVVYDFFYYIWRVATYEIPVIGGRARGRQRPRAPSLSERPDGTHRRLPSLGGSPSPGPIDGGGGEGGLALAEDEKGMRRRRDGEGTALVER